MKKRKQDRLSLNKDLFKKVYRIRRAEKAIQAYYLEDDMKTPMHMSMGEEAITAGVCAALDRRDQAFGYYRSHALYISKTNETDAFFAEMYGKVTGVVRGRGGSMHLASPDHGLLGVSAIVASTIAPAVGAAFANKMKKNGRVAAVFFGDGAAEEGVFWESLNAACLMKLPVIFVCEDNGLAVDITTKERQGFKSISAVAKTCRCRVIESKTTDPETIHRLTRDAIQHIEKTGQPVFMHLQYYRYLQHIGIYDDFSGDASKKGGFERAAYRSKAEFNRWLKRDPLALQRAKLLKLGVTERAVQAMEKTIDAEVESSVTMAKQAPFPPAAELHQHVFSDSGK
jgi:pyruvate dehydrogenase E1 component alpha subunit